MTLDKVGRAYSREDAERFLLRREYWRKDPISDPYRILQHLGSSAVLDREYSGSTIRVLDVCCGDGLASLEVKRRAGSVYSIGIEGCEYLAKRAWSIDRMIVGDAMQVEWPTGVQLVILPFCLYHLGDVQAVLEKAHASLVPNGVLLISVVRPDFMPELFHNWLGAPLECEALVVQQDGVNWKWFADSFELVVGVRHEYPIRFATCADALRYAKHSIRASEISGPPANPDAWPRSAMMKMEFEVLGSL